MSEDETFPFLPSMEVVELALAAHCECKHAHHRLDTNSVNTPLPNEPLNKEIMRYTIGEKLILRICLECFHELEKGNEFLELIDSSKTLSPQIGRGVVGDLYLDPRKSKGCETFLALLAKEFYECISKHPEAKQGGYEFNADGSLKIRCEPERYKFPPRE